MSTRKHYLRSHTPEEGGRSEPVTAPLRRSVLSRFLRNPWPALWVALLLGAFAVQAVTSMVWKSPTIDETMHLPAGYTYLAKHDYRVNPEHPPLVKMISALPLLFQKIDGNFDSERWRDGNGGAYGWEFLYRKNDADSLFFAARLMMVGLSLCLGLLIFFWARKMYGNGAGLFALFLFAFSPNLLAHGRLANTDVGVSLFMLLSLFCFDGATRKLTPLSAALAGVTLGLALLAKFSGGLMLPILGVVLLARVFDGKPVEAGLRRTSSLAGWRRKLPALAALFCVMLVFAYGTVWAGYGFRFKAVTEPDGKFGQRFSDAQKMFPPDALYRFAYENRLLPEAYLVGFHYLRTHMDRVAYLDGKRTEVKMVELKDEHGDPRKHEDGSPMKAPIIKGWRRYFIMTFLYKTPVPVIIFFALSVILAPWMSRRTWSHEAPLIAFFVTYYVVAIFSVMNIGHRHILPVLPVLFIFIAKIPSCLRQRKRRAAIMISVMFAGLLAWYAYGTLRIRPHYLAYFNEIAGGPEHAFEHLSDSNIDWGQDLKLLKRHMNEHGIDKVHLCYFGSADPTYYGIKFNPFPDRTAAGPPEGSCLFDRKGEYIAISGSILHETYVLHFLDPSIGPEVERRMRNITRRLRGLEPEAVIGYSIYLYRIPGETRVPVKPVGPQ